MFFQVTHPAAEPYFCSVIESTKYRKENSCVGANEKEIDGFFQGRRTSLINEQ
jgi:hypothetical protein